MDRSKTPEGSGFFFPFPRWTGFRYGQVQYRGIYQGGSGEIPLRQVSVMDRVPLGQVGLYIYTINNNPM